MEKELFDVAIPIRNISLNYSILLGIILEKIMRLLFQ
jgi:hypothetical protein